ncbi:BnaCnng75050D [Brassica napus]|uniref:BnaCnng75050D protein n=1 Tax=Brassica napus TaxID=3708 RepID=A0A078JYZ8_BRANA|nr:BnaCnng75050D [Brassica napus]
MLVGIWAGMYNTLILMVQHMSGLSLAASLTLLAKF